MSQPTVYKDTISDKELKQYYGTKFFKENKATALKAEEALRNIEEDITSDLVTVPIMDANGMPTGEYRVVSMTTGAEVSRGSELQNDEVDPLLTMGELIQKEKEVYDQATQAPPTLQKSTPAATRTASLEHLGLGFLTDPPSLPTRTVKLQLAGPVKFGASIQCHDFVVTDQFVILVTDKRIKPEAVDLALEDSSLETLLITENEIISVHPPVPSICTYDVGVLRHFVFIRKASESIDRDHDTAHQ